MAFEHRDLQVLPDSAALAVAAAELFIHLASSAIAGRGRFSAALSGGSTPLNLFQVLRQAEYARRVDWSRVHLFWGDERCVSADHPDSNYRAVREALLKFVPIPLANIHRIPGEFEPEAAAQAYENTLRRFFAGESPPRFDLILLGLGDDGHTASLFPGSPAVAEQERWVISAEHTTPPPPLVSRITLTLPVINAARRVVFLVSGAGKAKILGEVLKLGKSAETYPAQLIRPRDGQLTWLVDRDAAGRQ